MSDTSLTASTRDESRWAIAARLEPAMTTVRRRRRHFGARAAAVREHLTGWAHAADSSHSRLFVGRTTPQEALQTIGVLAAGDPPLPGLGLLSVLRAP